jgi:glycerol uptake facilitator-like aquaporin
MEVPGSSDRKLSVFLYELIGTSLLTYAVTMNNANAYSVAFFLYILLVIVSPISGGHLNPAVTIGVFVNEKKFGEDAVLLGMTIAAQFVGAFIGIVFTFLSYGNFYDSWQQLHPNGSIPSGWIPSLCPVGLSTLS